MLLRTRLRNLYRRKKDDISFYLSVFALVLGLISIVDDWKEALLVVFVALVSLSYSYNRILKRMRSRYNSIVYDDPNFYQWQLKVLNILYTDKKFVEVDGRKFPCTVPLKGEFTCRMVEGFDFKTEKDIRRICRAKQNSKGMSFWNRMKFKLIIEHSLSYPEIPGYMLDRLHVESGEFVCKIGSYIQNCHTSLILEYELYLAYLRASKDSLNNFVGIPTNIRDMLPLRMRIHRECRKYGYDETTLGDGRMSLLSVQMMVIYYNHKGEACTIIKKRAEDGLSSLSGYYQFVPAGGFELFEREKNCYNPDVIKNGCDPELAVWREFLEEMFDQQDFQGIYSTERDNPRHKVESTYQVKYIKDLISHHKADLIRVGSVMDMSTLRHTLSYILYIQEDNGEFEREIVYRVKFNDEFSGDNSYCNGAITLKELKRIFRDGRMNVTPDTAGLYYMARKVAKRYGFGGVLG